MTRMSIDVPLKSHKRIKVIAVAEGLSIRVLVIEYIAEKEKIPNKMIRRAMAVARKDKETIAKV